jgi:phosphatidylglycerophosphatase C
MLAALLVTPIAGPLVAMPPTRTGISVYVWIGSFLACTVRVISTR